MTVPRTGGAVTVPRTGGAARYTSGAGLSATLTTNASDIGLIVTRSAGSGHARISIDGVLVATVSIRRGATAYRQLIYSRHFPTVGPHTFQVEVVGDGRVELDAFEVLR